MIGLVILREDTGGLAGLSPYGLPFSVRSFNGGDSLALRAVRRNARLCSSAVIAAEQADFEGMRGILGSFGDVTYFIEPSHRGIAPLVSLIAHQYVDETILLTPGWYDFDDEEAYAASVSEAEKLAAKGHIVKIGGGMVCFQASVLLEELKRISPEFYSISFLVHSNKRSTQVTHKFCGKYMEKFPPATVTDALLCKSENKILMPPVKGCRVMDNFSTIYESASRDKNGNASANMGDSYGVAEFSGAKGNMVFLEHRDVTLLGVDDLVVVDTGTRLIIAKKGEDIEQRLKELNG